MKKLVLIIAAVFFGTTMTKAETLEDKVVINTYRYGNSFIFVENGVTFSVYPDGEFDFYIDNQVNVGLRGRVGNVGVTFNSGFNYNPFVQYDDYGAIVQVENVPVYYDFYGRVSQIGGVDVWYRNNRVRRIGGLNVFYNGGTFSHYTGFINIYNRNYVYRPFHRWFARPAVGFCNVWTTPYRRWYNPVRYTWYRPYRNNFRNAYVNRGNEYRFNKSRRANVYRNDNRVAVRENRGRRGDFGKRGNSVSKSDRRFADSGRSSSNRSAVQRNKSVRQRDAQRGNNVAQRSNRGTSVTQRTVTRTPRSTSVTKREVTRTPQKRTVSRSTTTYRKPQATQRRSVVSNRSTQKRTQSVQRSTPQRRTTTVKRTSTPQRKTVSRSSSSSSRRSTGTISRGRSARGVQ